MAHSSVTATTSLTRDRESYRARWRSPERLTKFWLKKTQILRKLPIINRDGASRNVPVRRIHARRHALLSASGGSRDCVAPQVLRSSALPRRTRRPAREPGGVD